MKKILITGGTVFVSRYAAQYFVDKGYEVYVVNRNSRPQVPGVKLIETDRHDLGDKLKDIYFDVVADITAYNAEDITDLCDSLGSFGQYIMISSSAVYPEYGDQPFREDSERALNRYWGSYGTDKIAAEDALLDRVSDAYILRPPYIYGPMNNVYREAFVFDCARADRPFYLPGDGGMKLQFFHVKDLCILMERVIEEKPETHIMNVGNVEPVTIKDWVTMCYACFDKIPAFVNVSEDIEQRNYFSFYNYEYYLDVQQQNKIYSETISLEDGLKECAEWYVEMDEVISSQEEMERLLKSFQVVGGGNTDFRPAFTYVNQLIKEGSIRHLDGLLYFTDGKGIYPVKKPEYKTAFLFLGAYDETAVPPWAMRLQLEPEELEQNA